MHSSGKALVFMDERVDQPTILREKISVTNAVYTNPTFVRTYVMSATHSRFGRSAVNLRLTRSARVSACLPLRVVIGPQARLAP